VRVTVCTNGSIGCFRNAAAHLNVGGRFVIENDIPELRRLPPGETDVLFITTG
jgi:hypothetical protein